jgi:hypothetical protein
VHEIYGRVLLFHVDDSEPPNWNEIQPSVPFLISKGVSIHDMRCFEQRNHLKKFMGSYLSDEELTNLLAHRKWTTYFENSKKWRVPLRIVEDFLCHCH